MTSADEDRNQISTAGWTLEGVLAFAPIFRPIERISATSSSDNITSAIEKFEENGVPVIIDGWHHHKKWPKEIFTLDFFQKHSATNINVRNVHDRKDGQMLLDEFVRIARNTPPCAPPGEQVRMYGKDAECPQEWSAWIKDAKVIPEALHWNGSNDYFRYRPKNAQVETLMCYLGVGDTFTPAHKDLCASSGHNLMCWTENGGSSFWFMTKSADAAAASALFQKLGAELDHEMHVVTLKELAGAPFTIYVAEQKLGDMVLVPPRSCHQVVNYGGITLKTSWSRMTLNGLLMAYYHELPIYQRVCRLETYRVKSTIFVALRKQTKELEDMHPFRSADTSKPKFKGKPNSRVLATMESLKTLLTIFREIMAQEWSAKDWDCIEPFVGESNDEKTMETRIVCDFCGADIFQSFFECNNLKKKCAGAPDPGSAAEVYTVCPGCYVEGRSCKCGVMTPGQCLHHAELLRVSEQASQALEDFNAGWTPPPLNANYSTFKAACALAKDRIRRICIYDKDKVETDTIYCKPCHHSKCYAHLLRMNKIHAVEGIEKISKDPLSFHLTHRRSKETYTKSMDKILDSQKSGTSGPIDMLRVHYALVYPTCFPRSIEYSLGFYDTHVLDYDEVDTGTPLNWSPLPPMGVHNTDSDELAEVTAPLTKLPLSMENAGPSPKGPKTKRLIPYVQVPSAPYLIRERLPVLSDVVSKGRGKDKARTMEDIHNPGRGSSRAGTFFGKSSDDERPRWTAKPRGQKDAEHDNFKHSELSISTRLSNGNGPKRQIGSDSGPLAPLVSSPAPPLRHRFKSGMFVTLHSSPGIVPPKPAVESTPAPPSPSETHAASRDRSQPPELRQKRKREQIDGGDHALSLAEAMNRASAVNSHGVSGTRKRSRIDAISWSSPIQHLSSHTFPDRNERGKGHRANQGSRIKSEINPQANREESEVKSTKAIAANEDALREAMTAHALVLALKPEVRRHLVANGYRVSNPNSNPFQAISPQLSQCAGLNMAATALRRDHGAGPSSESFDSQTPTSGRYADEQIPSERAQHLDIPTEHQLSSPSNPCSLHQSPGAVAGSDHERSTGTHDNPPPLQPPQPPAKEPRLTRRSLRISQSPKTQPRSSNHRPGGRFKKARLRQSHSSRPSSGTVPMLRRNHSNSPQRRPKLTLSQKLQHERMLLQRRKGLRLEPGSPGKQHRRSKTEAPKSSL